MTSFVGSELPVFLLKIRNEPEPRLDAYVGSIGTPIHIQPRACRPYRAKTKGKVERPFRYIREDFFLGSTFRNLDELNARLCIWLDEVANARRHATTGRVVQEAFAEERPALRPLPLAPYRAVLKLERRVSHEGMVSVGGNLYSVPDTTRRRILDVHVLAGDAHLH